MLIQTQIPLDRDFKKEVSAAVKKLQKSGQLRSVSDGYVQLGGLADYTNLKNYMDGKTNSIPFDSAQKVKDTINRLEAEKSA
jgi:hypothetical protein